MSFFVVLQMYVSDEKSFKATICKFVTLRRNKLDVPHQSESCVQLLLSFFIAALTHLFLVTSVLGWFPFQDRQLITMKFTTIYFLRQKVAYFNPEYSLLWKMWLFYCFMLVIYSSVVTLLWTHTWYVNTFCPHTCASTWWNCRPVTVHWSYMSD